ncbi:MAG: cytochrome P460 family protein [Alphaproteobacteria bacterium]
MKFRVAIPLAAGAALLTAALLPVSFPATGQEKAPDFGGKKDTEYAAKLWKALERERLVGPRAILAVPYEGQEPHGAILVTLEGNVEVGDHTGIAMVKRNYGGPDISKEKVSNNPDENLGAITIMYRREQGYDPEHENWFWAKYNADGTLQTSPKDMKLAGRVASCIQCHQAAPGEDYVYTHDRLTGD